MPLTRQSVDSALAFIESNPDLVEVFQSGMNGLQSISSDILLAQILEMPDEQIAAVLPRLIDDKLITAQMLERAATNEEKRNLFTTIALANNGKMLYDCPQSGFDLTEFLNYIGQSRKSEENVIRQVNADLSRETKAIIYWLDFFSTIHFGENHILEPKDYPQIVEHFKLYFGYFKTLFALQQRSEHNQFEKFMQDSDCLKITQPLFFTRQRHQPLLKIIELAEKNKLLDFVNLQLVVAEWDFLAYKHDDNHPAYTAALSNRYDGLNKLIVWGTLKPSHSFAIFVWLFGQEEHEDKVVARLKTIETFITEKIIAPEEFCQIIFDREKLQLVRKFDYCQYVNRTLFFLDNIYEKCYPSLTEEAKKQIRAILLEELKKIPREVASNEQAHKDYMAQITDKILEHIHKTNHDHAHSARPR